MATDLTFDQFRSTVTGRLAQLPETLTAEHLSRVATAVQTLASADSLTKLRVALGSAPHALHDAAAGSYFHDNAFLKLLLMDSTCNRFRFRIHWWKANANTLRIRQNIHNHRFHFYSFVLIGGLTNTLWRVSSEGAPYVHYTYHPRLNKDTYLLSKVGTTLLRVNHVSHQAAGNKYYLNAEALHTSEPAKGKDVITLFVEDRVSIRSYADVYSNRYTGREIIISSPAISAPEYIAGLSDLSLMLATHEPRF